MQPDSADGPGQAAGAPPDQAPRAYHLVLARHGRARPEVQALAAWLEQTARQEAE